LPRRAVGFSSVGRIVKPERPVAPLRLLFRPLILASNVFVAPQTMPGWLQAFVHINPVSHLVTAERGLLAGHAATGQIAWVLIASAALTAP
jgi:ABC-2 type transport system permease protein